MSSSGRRVVVTGLGVICPLGRGVASSWAKLCGGKSGIRTLLPSHLETDTNPAAAWDPIPSKVAGYVPRGTADDEFDEDSFTASERRSMSLGMKYGMVAAEEAVADADLDPSEDGTRCGVAVGMAMVDLDYIHQSYQHVREGNHRKVSPFFVPRILPNLAPGHISMRFGLRGPNHSVSTACATGSHAVGDAFNFIRHGAADVMICGGVEACINPLAMMGFARARALSTKFNSEPEKASRPFDKDRDGFVIGEGGGLLVLEELERAKERKAKIYGEVVGYGLSGDAHHITAGREDGEGALSAMRDAFRDVGLERLRDLWYINAHATSTPKGDLAELTAISKLLEGQDISPYISSTKGQIGHLLGAAGSVESIFALKSLSSGVIPANANADNVENVSKETENIVRGASVEEKPLTGRRLILKNSFGFGGTNVSLLFAEYNQ